MIFKVFHRTVTFILFIGLYYFMPIAQISALSLSVYVDKNSVGGYGCNDNWPGTLTQPICTINKAQNLISAGGTVFVRGGNYNSRVLVSSGSGTNSAPVTYMPYQNEIVYIDGTGLNLNDGSDLFQLYGVHDIHVKGFTIKNSSGRGLGASNSTNIVFQQNTVHGIYYRGIGASGTNITIDRNTVYNAGLSNANGAFGNGGWPAIISTWLQSDDTSSKNIYITNNTIYNSWGEGIDVIGSDGVTIKGNRVYDTYSVLIYMDNSRNVRVEGNYISATNSTYYRSGKPAHGIMISAESCCVPNPSYPSENITISNNLIVQANNALRYWAGDSGNTYRNVSIFHNTIYGSIGTALNFDSASTSGNQFRNNIIYGTASVGNSSAWSFSNNNWPSGKPLIDTSSSSFAADPKFVNPNVLGPAEGYKLQLSSTSIGKGISVPVTTDYFGTARKSPPTLGFYEDSSTVGLLGDANGDGVVDGRDYSIWASKYGQSISGAINGDFNNNGLVDVVDFGIWKSSSSF